MLYLIELEPVETRYTAEWQEHLPKQLTAAGIPNTVITGPADTPTDTTPGAFLNFSGTNYWKSHQCATISKLFADGIVKPGDYFLYTDAWNTTALQVRYMSDLLDIPVYIGGMWHAGSYDPNDFLGRVKNKGYLRHTEQALHSAFDHNFFATQYHIDLFNGVFTDADTNKQIRTGWPMEYLKQQLSETIAQHKLAGTQKNIILFPHRLAPEKQPELFKILQANTSGRPYNNLELVIAQETPLSKQEYWDLLCKSRIVFSANLQETLGISLYEGVLCGAAPFVPNRLSYTEMYPSQYHYPTEWCNNYANSVRNQTFIKNKLLLASGNPNFDLVALEKHLTENYFSGKIMYEIIKKTLDK